MVFLLQVSLLAVVLGTYVGADDSPPGAADNVSRHVGHFLSNISGNDFCPEGFTLEGTMCYRLVKDFQMNWAEANAFCNALTVNWQRNPYWQRNAYLAEFQSANEAQKAVYMLLSDDKECATWEQAEGDDDGGEDSGDDGGEDSSDDGGDERLSPGTKIWIGAHFVYNPLGQLLHRFFDHLIGADVMMNGFRWNQNGKPMGHLLRNFWEQGQPKLRGGSAVTMNCDTGYKFRSEMKNKKYPFICMIPFSILG